MDNTNLQKIYQYFLPLNKKTALRDISNESKPQFNPIKFTPKSSFSRPSTCLVCRKRAHALELSSQDETKKTRLQSTETEGLSNECVVENKAVAVKSSSKAEEEASCSSTQQKLPDELHVDYSLEILSHPQVSSTAFESISAEVLGSLLTSMSADHFYKKFLLVDCRYPFEYVGGHIKGAINIHDPNEISNVFFPSDVSRFSIIAKKIPIFYCEFSQKRGPAMAYQLRAYDRIKNESRYPEVDYKEIYLLDHGYNGFFKIPKLRGLCEPNAYVRMVDSRHSRELRKYNLHRSKAIVSTSKHCSQLAPRFRRDRLQYISAWSTRSCPSFDVYMSSSKKLEKNFFVQLPNDDKEELFPLCMIEEDEDSQSDTFKLNISGSFENSFIPE